MQRHLYEHFQVPRHSSFLKVTYVTFMTNPTTPTKLEDYWINTLKTKASMGRHVEGGY